MLNKVSHDETPSNSVKVDTDLFQVFVTCLQVKHTIVSDFYQKGTFDGKEK